MKGYIKYNLDDIPILWNKDEDFPKEIVYLDISENISGSFDAPSLGLTNLRILIFNRNHGFINLNSLNHLEMIEGVYIKLSQKILQRKRIYLLKENLSNVKCPKCNRNVDTISLLNLRKYNDKGNDIKYFSCC